MSRPLLLLVDDAPHLGFIVERLGTRVGCEVIARTDVPTAWEFLQSRVPALVLLDLNLPGPSGLELCRRIRANETLGKLPIALFCQDGLSEDVAAGLQAGADYLFSKELVGNPAQWEARLAEILAGASTLGLVVERSDSSNTDPGLVADDWFARLNRAVRLLRGLGPPVVQVLLSRALSAAFASQGNARDWLLPDGAALDARRVPLKPTAVATLAVSLSRQAWSLLGTEGSAPFQTALVSAFPRLLQRNERDGFVSIGQRN